MNYCTSRYPCGSCYVCKLDEDLRMAEAIIKKEES